MYRQNFYFHRNFSVVVYSDYPLPWQQFNSGSKFRGIKCYNCSRYGHIARYCKKPIKRVKMVAVTNKAVNGECGNFDDTGIQHAIESGTIQDSTDSSDGGMAAPASTEAMGCTASTEAMGCTASTETMSIDEGY